MQDGFEFVVSALDAIRQLWWISIAMALGVAAVALHFFATVVGLSRADAPKRVSGEDD